MADVSAEVGQPAEFEELTKPSVAAVLVAAGWAGERRSPAKEWATTWQRADTHAWTQGEGDVVPPGRGHNGAAPTARTHMGHSGVAVPGASGNADRTSEAAPSPTPGSYASSISKSPPPPPPSISVTPRTPLAPTRTHAGGMGELRDLIGTPTDLVDESGTVAWRARCTLWGATAWPKETPSLDSTTTTSGTSARKPVDASLRTHWVFLRLRTHPPMSVTR